MARFNNGQNSFIAGEISPKALGRIELDQYKQSAEEIKNFVVRSIGGATRRMGSKYILDNLSGTALDSETRVIPFIFSEEEAYLVLISTGNNGITTQGFAIYNISTDSVITPTTSTLNSNYTQFQAYSSMDELRAIKYAQSGDIMILVSTKNPPLILKRTGASTFALYDIFTMRSAVKSERQPYGGTLDGVLEKLSKSDIPNNFYYNVPYKDISIQLQDAGWTGTPSGTTGSITVTLTSPGKWTTFTNAKTILRITHGGTTGFVRIDSISPTDTINGTVIKTLGGTSGVSDIQVQAWDEDYGWPETVAFHQQRVVYGGTKEDPDTKWASQTGDFVEMMVKRSADDSEFGNISNDRPFEFTIASNRIDQIQWMLSGRRKLFSGTLGTEYIVEGSDPNLALGPLNVGFNPETRFGSHTPQAVEVDGSVIFCDRSRRRLRELVFNRDETAYRANDLNYFADHILEKGLSKFDTVNDPEILEIFWQSYPNPVIWVLDSNGLLHGLTRDRQFGVKAWHSHELGGYSNAEQDEPAKITSFCVVSNNSGSNDDIWAIVSRHIDGSTVTYLEQIGQEFIGTTMNYTGSNGLYIPRFLDSSFKLDEYTNLTFFANYNSDINATRYEGDDTGTGTNSPSVSSGALDLTGGTNKYVTYDADSNADNQQTGTIFLRVTPNYSGSPAANRSFVAISDTDSSDNNLIHIRHTSAGNLEAIIKNSAGATLDTLTYAWSPTSGTEYDITLSYDLDSGAWTLYLDGVSRDTSTATGTRDSSIANFVVGSSYDGADNSDFTIGMILVRSSATTVSREQPYLVNKYIEGIFHLEGQVVDVLADGEYAGQHTVTNGAIELTNPASTVIFGLPFESKIVTNDIEAGSVLGSSKGQTKRIHEITMEFSKTIGVKYGPDSSSLIDLDFRDFNSLEGPIALYTGDKTVRFNGTNARDAQLVLVQDKPFPCEIVSLNIKGQTND